MSRYLLIGLIITNLGVGGYFLQRDVAQPQTASVDASPPTDRSASGVPASSVPAIAEVVTRPSLPDPLLQAVESTEHLRGNSAAIAADGASSAEDASNASPATVAAIDSDVYSDIDSDAATAAVERVLRDASDKMSRTASTRECRVWGPVADPQDFADLERSLIKEGGLPEVREIDVALPPDYLVVVNGIASMAEARQVAGALGALQIDNYVVNREESGPAVAVGVFSRQTLAQRQQARVAQLGYDVSVEPMQRSQTAYNLVAHVTRESDQFETSTSACLDIAQNH